MTAGATDYTKAQEELRALEERLERMQKAHPAGSKGFTKAGIRKMIARGDRDSGAIQLQPI